MTSWSIFDLPTKQEELALTQKQTEDPQIWNDPIRAQGVMKRLADLGEEIDLWQGMKKRIDDAEELITMNDPSFENEIVQDIDSLEKELAIREFEILLSGPYDQGNAILEISSGAGGTESQDWASMLERMYLRWCENHRYKTNILDRSEGEEAGIKSSTISVEGKHAYGYLHCEKGVHRLVRLSPFDANHRRHTSFAKVEVLPEVSKEDPTIQINPEDLKIDTFRSSGAGGQNVQKNSTAVRITHIPTGIVVSCQNERSQIQNRENALRVLRARLLQISQEEKEKELARLRGKYIKTEWGSQIRSYVLHPYQLVKDHRTEHETSSTQSVLNGNIDDFIQACLKQK
jgi:peptide chain release factor 2